MEKLLSMALRDEADLQTESRPLEYESNWLEGEHP